MADAPLISSRGKRAGVSGLRALYLLLVVLFLPCVATGQEESPGPGSSLQNILPDPAVRFGTLPNGMRYALMRNLSPPGRVSIRFEMKFGSLDEDADEQGLAHFIEHMAFNGSRHIPEGEAVKMLQRLGLAFGADANAQTSLDHTSYKFDLPRADDETLDEGLFLVREIASELTFDSAAITREKGVVLSEERRGDTFVRQRMQQQLDFLLPGAYAASRMPIGKAEVIEQATHDQLQSLYDRYYRPERASLVIVGDVDVDRLESLIRAKFSDWKGRGPGGREPALDYSFPPHPAAASVFTHKDGGDSIAVYSLSPYVNHPDTAANRQELTKLGLGVAILNRRLERMTNGPSPPFMSATMQSADLLRAANVSSALVMVTPGGWRNGLAALEQEWRRALRYGFTQQELEQQATELLAGAAEAEQRASTRTSGQLSSQLSESIREDVVFSTPSATLARLKGWTRDLTAAEVSDVFRRHMTVDQPRFFLSTTSPDPGADEAMPAKWRDGLATAVAPPTVIAPPSFAYVDFGPVGRVAKDKRLADIDARLVTFANHVRLNIKRTTFEKDTVRVSVRVAGGAIALEEGPIGLSSLMKAFSAGGLEKHSADDLRSIIAGHHVQLGLSISPTAFTAVYTTTPEDLTFQLQLAAAYVAHPGYRPEAERAWRQSLVRSWPRLDADPKSTFGNRGVRELTEGDRRLGNDPADGEYARSFTELKSWLDPWLSRGAIEIAIVGDVEEEAAIAAVAQTFGALPERSDAPGPTASRHEIRFRPPGEQIVLYHGGEADQALVDLFWHVDLDPDAEPQKARVLGVLGALLQLKATERVREEMGASYAPLAAFSSSSVYPGLSYLVAGAEVKPADVDRVAMAFRSIAADLVSGRISADDLMRATAPLRESLPTHASSNAYWLALLAEAQTRPGLLKRSTVQEIAASIDAVSLDDLKTAAVRWLAPGMAIQLTVLPRSAAGR